MLNFQEKSLNKIEKNTEQTYIDTEIGTNILSNVVEIHRKYKYVSILIGGSLGMIIAEPIGLLVGLKYGSIFVGVGVEY